MADPHATPFPPVLAQAVEESAAAFFKGAFAMSRAPDGAAEGHRGAGIMSTISFVSDVAWAFAMAVPEDTAVQLAKGFAGFDIPFDSPDMGDLIGEVANVIAGDISGRLAKKGVPAQMSLPTVVRGDDVSVLVPSGSDGSQFTMAGPIGGCRFHLVGSRTPVAHPGSAKPPAAEPAVAPADRAAEPAPTAPSTWEVAQAAERELATQDAAPGLQARAVGAAPAPGRPGRERGGYRLACLTLVFACGGWGAAASLLVTGARRVPVVVPPVAATTEPRAAEPAAANPLAAIDALILAGKYNDGLRACLDCPRHDPRVPGTALALREGLCLEGIGRSGEAANAYRTAEADPSAAVTALALVGQVRCAARDESFVLARALANRALLRSAHPDCRGLRLCEQVRQLRARIAALEAGGEKHAPPAPPPAGLDALGRPAQPAPRPTLEVHRALESPGVLHVSADLGRRPAADVVRDVAATAGLAFRPGAGTVERLGHAVGPVHIDHLPLPELLDALTEGTGVTWALTADVLTLAPAVAEPKSR